jgi:hypothetical protein
VLALVDHVNIVNQQSVSIAVSCPISAEILSTRCVFVARGVKKLSLWNQRLGATAKPANHEARSASVEIMLEVGAKRLVQI